MLVWWSHTPYPYPHYNPFTSFPWLTAHPRQPWSLISTYDLAQKLHCYTQDGQGIFFLIAFNEINFLLDFLWTSAISCPAKKPLAKETKGFCEKCRVLICPVQILAYICSCTLLVFSVVTSSSCPPYTQGKARPMASYRLLSASHPPLLFHPLPALLLLSWRGRHGYLRSSCPQPQLPQTHCHLLRLRL